MKNVIIVFLLIIAVAAIGGAAYFYGKSQSNSPSLTATTTNNSNPTANSGPAATSSPQATPTPAQTVSVTGANVFTSFIATVPGGWNVDKSQIAGATKLTLTNGSYQLVISQGAGGGATCIYPGDTPTDFSSEFNAFVTLTGGASEFRRATAKAGSPAGTEVYTVCEKKSGSFGLPTQFGYITYNTPASPDAAALSAMDTIVASLKKQ